MSYSRISRFVATLTLICVSSSGTADTIEEITVTATQPSNTNHSFDIYWFNQLKVRDQGTIDDDMDQWEYYLDMQDDYEECLIVADSRVSQCKDVYAGYPGAILCAVGVGYAIGLLGRFIPEGSLAEALGIGSATAAGACTALTITAVEWCETDFQTMVVQNCMDEDGS